MTRKGWAKVSTFMSVTSAPVKTGLATFGTSFSASGDFPAYTPSVHTGFFAADCGLSCPAELLTIEAAIAPARVQNASRARTRDISVLLFDRPWISTLVA